MEALVFSLSDNLKTISDLRIQVADGAKRCVLKRFLLLIAVLFLFSTQVQAKTDVYGKGVSIAEKTPVSAIFDNPDAYIGKPVRVEGMILEVCSKRGCWVYLASDRQGEKIQVKVVDGEIVFPMSASGRMAVVEGVVEALEMSREEMLKYMQHLAEEKGQPFDPATVKDERVIRLKGIGAQIEG